MTLEYRGTRLTIRYCEQSPEGVEPDDWIPPSWQKALQHIPAPKHPSCWAKMLVRREHLANEGQLRSPDHWNTEGTLPDGKHFYAIKADRLRAYGWFSNCHKRVFYISHFAYKKGRKLAQEDTNQVIKNWRLIEER